jgi:eukaryotic-like serine/threonine-protein kinase
MNNERQRERELFLAAMEMSSAEQRRSFLERECGKDTGLKERLFALLECSETAECFFKALPVSWDGATQKRSGEAEGVGATLSRYKLLEVIGIGGFGVVYMAEQTEPIRRRVALKVLKQGLDTQEVIARFEAERQALAMLDHPNVARVLDAGATETGRPYFVMELVHGCPITEYCDQNRLSARERLELFIPVCLAVQHAHQKGIIHRDLKPSNILVTRLDGRAVPKIIDFGVAKAVSEPLTGRTLFTRFGRMIGTPAYMSPEQAELSGTDIDTRSDIYSLGVVLYELLTGKAPLEPERLHQAALAEMQRIIHEEEPPRPSARISTLGNESRAVAERRQTDPQKLGRLLTGDLDWIVMKTLEKDRQRRYASAAALAEDIERHLREQPVMAGPPRLSYRVGKFVRRHRRMALTLALGMVFLLTGFLVATLGFLKARQERDRALAAENQSDRERRLALQEAQKAKQREAHERMIAYTSDMSLAKAAADSGDLGRSLSLLNRHWPLASQTDLRDWEWRYLWKEGQSDALATLYRHTNAIYKLSVSPDGQEVALGGFDGVLLVVDLGSRQLKARLQDSGPPCLVQYSPRENLLAATDDRGALRLWRAPSPASSQPLDGPERVAAIAFSRDGATLAAVGKPDRLWLWDVTTGRAIANCALALPFEDVHCGGLVFASSPGQVWVGGQNGVVALVEVSSGRLRTKWRAHAGLVSTLAVSPKDQSLASGAGFLDSMVKEWDPVQHTSLGELKGHRAWVTALAYSPDGSVLAPVYELRKSS